MGHEAELILLFFVVLKRKLQIYSRPFTTPILEEASAAFCKKYEWGR
jgi:hypothetical protein